VEEVPDRPMACKGIKEAEDAMAREVKRCSGSKSESGRAGLSALQIQSCMYQAEASRSASA
jgi:hypothetical protein